MPRMTPEQLESYLSRQPWQRGIPVLDALLVNDSDEGVPAGTEIKRLHQPIMEECKRRGWRFDYKKPTQATGSTVGVPDFLIWADAGRFLAVECKTAEGRLSPAQSDFKRDIEKLGHRFYEVRSFKRFLEIANGKV